MNAAEVIVEVWNDHDLLLHDDPAVDLLACDGCDWTGPTSEFNPHLADAVLDALTREGYQVVRGQAQESTGGDR